jgi:hypothetical protein
MWDKSDFCDSLAGSTTLGALEKIANEHTRLEAMEKLNASKPSKGVAFPPGRFGSAIKFLDRLASFIKCGSKGEAVTPEQKHERELFAKTVASLKEPVAKPKPPVR